MKRIELIICCLFALSLSQAQNSLNLTSPNGGEKWQVGSVQDIEWICHSELNPIVNLEYSINNGNSWIPIVNDFISNDTGINHISWVYKWEVLPPTTSNNCLIKVEKSSNGNFDLSDSIFSIVFNSSINEQQTSLSSIILFPNPTILNSYLEIELKYPDNIDILVFDEIGRKVITIYQGHLHKGKQLFTIPSSNLSDGTYLITLKSNGIISTKQLIVRH